MIAADRHLARDVMGWTLTRLRRDRVEHPDPAHVHALITHVLPSIAPDNGAVSWQQHDTHWTSADLAVAAVGPQDAPPRAMIRLAGELHAQRSLHQHTSAIRALHTDPRLDAWQSLVPLPLCEGKIGAWSYAAEQMMPGVPALSLPANSKALTQLQVASATAISHLHQRTASWVCVDDDLLRRWVDEPLQRIHAALAILPRPLRADAALPRLAREIRATLTSRTMQVGWVHGDFWPGNVLVDSERKTPVGIVDWEWSSASEPPSHDLFHLLLYTRSLTQQRELGDVVREALARPQWTPIERYILSLGMPTDRALERALVLLYWIRHIASNLDQSPQYARHHVWVARNVNAVLRSL